MRRRLFSLGGTEVYIHLATFLYGLYMVLLGHGRVMIISLLSISVHEAAHAAVACSFGKIPGEIEITPLGAVLRLEDEECLPAGQRLMMLLAGPMASLALCWFAILLTRSRVLPLDTGRLLFSCNLLLFLGNLLPALPMDGGRVLSMLLSLRLRQETVRRIMRLLGTCMGLGLICLNLFVCIRYGGWNFSLAMAGCFLMYAGAACTTSAALAELRSLMDRKIRLECKGALRCQWVAVRCEMPLRRAIQRLTPNAYTMFVCVDGTYSAVPHPVDESKVIAAYLDDPSAACSVLFH